MFDSSEKLFESIDLSQRCATSLLVIRVRGGLLPPLATALLLIASISPEWILQVPLGVSEASSSELSMDRNVEYSNGSIPLQYPGLALWYAWINTSDTQVIFLAYCSHVANSPLYTFVGQHFYTENGTEIFVGSHFFVTEMYNDTNGNGFPDTDHASGKSEILYHLVYNSSVAFEITPIEKTIISNLPHYKWGIRYDTIDGILTSETLSPIATFRVDFIAFSYDFYIQNNTSYLKTNFGIGKIEISPFDGVLGSSTSLEGLSLALFYGTVVAADEPYATFLDGNPYNSTTAPPSIEPISLGEIKIQDAKAYDFVFEQNYTLFRDSKPETYESKATTVPSLELPSNSEVRTEIVWVVLSDVDTVLLGLFPGMRSLRPSAPYLDINASSFLYSVCYPVWDGYPLEHDPTYIAYLNVGKGPEPILPVVFVIVATAVSTAALVAAVCDLKKTRKMFR